jgi:hypothetical protein
LQDFLTPFAGHVVPARGTGFPESDGNLTQKEGLKEDMPRKRYSIFPIVISWTGLKQSDRVWLKMGGMGVKRLPLDCRLENDFLPFKRDTLFIDLDGNFSIGIFSIETGEHVLVVRQIECTYDISEHR